MTLTIGSIFRSLTNLAGTLPHIDDSRVGKLLQSYVEFRRYTPDMSFPRQSFAAAVVAIAAGAFSMAAQAQPAQAPLTGPVYVVTHVDIIGGQQGIADAIKLMHDFQAASLKDKGAVRFEVLQQDGRLNHFVMLEVWQSREAYDAHNGLEHARNFREKIGPMLGSPFDVRLHRMLP